MGLLSLIFTVTVTYPDPDPGFPGILWADTLETWEGFHRTSRYGTGTNRNQLLAIL